MTSKLFGTTAIAAGMALWASTALASTTLYVGAQEAGVNGGAITTLASGPSQLLIGTGALGSVVYGTFSFGMLDGTGTPPLPAPGLSVSDFNVYTTTPGQTINIFLTETGLTTPIPNASILSTLDYNMNGGTFTMSGKTWYSDTDQVYTGTQISPLGSITGSNNATGSESVLGSADLSGTYSISLELTIESGAVGAGGFDWANNNGISLSAVPEPASLSLLGGGLLAFGAWRRRKKQAA